MRTMDRVVAVLLLLLAGGYLYATLRLPNLQLSDPMGPKAFPYLLAGGLAVAAVLLFWGTFRSAAESDGAATVGGAGLDAAGTGDDRAMLTRQLTGVAYMAVWTLIYYIALEPIGFIIATSVYLIVLLAFLHPRHWIMNPLIAGGFSVAAYLFFARLLSVTLPAGLMAI